MRSLFFLALSNRKTRALLFVTLISMCLMTFASQLEILSVGVITNKGPDFFELFAPIRGGQLEPNGQVTEEILLQRWSDLDPHGKGVIDRTQVSGYLREHRGKNIIEWLIDTVQIFFPLSTHPIYLALFILFVAFWKAITLFIHRFTTRLVAIRISRDLRQHYFEHMQLLPMEFYQKYHAGSLSARVVGDATLIAEAVNASFINYLQTPFTVLTTLALCFFTSWKLSLVIFFGFPLIIFPIQFLARKVKRISRQIQKHQENFASVLLDFLGGIQTVKAFGMEDFSRKKYSEQNDRMAVLERKSARYDLSSRPVVHTIGMLFLTTALLYGLYVLQMNVAEVIVYCGLLYVFYEPIKKFAEENSHIQKGVAAAERMMEILSERPTLTDCEGAFALKDFHSQIEFDHVWFRYGEEWVLKDLSFTIRRGEKVAIVGPTGAGKSTIAQLLPRLYEVQKGEIRIDGRPIRGVTQKSLRELIAFVPQKPFLFLDTIAENIAFGRPYQKNEIEEAALHAQAEEFICRLPERYETLLSETGKNLSGGQQQRLAIARAFFKRAPILLMDEATSSLDAVSESHIKEALKRFKGRMTQIIIAHRLSTIEDADRIIYLERGQKIAEGTRDEMLLHCPPFRAMWELMHQPPPKEVLQ